MSTHKTYLPIFASILFSLSAVILVSNIFEIPVDAGQEYFMDKFFYYGAITMFYVCAPYLLGLIIRKVIWKAEFKNSVRANTIGKLEDVIIISIYLISFSILFTKIFITTISLTLIFVSFTILILFVYVKPRFIKYSKTGFIQSSRPFKIGDWIGLINQNGINYLVGKVVGFNGKSVQLVSENNTLLILPNSLLTNFVIENYKSLSQKVKFSLVVSLSSQIPVEQAKRILIAGTLHALSCLNNNSEILPSILISKANKDFTEFKIIYSIIPWEPISPEIMKDIILTKIIDHLKVAGLGFNGIQENYNPLTNVELFKSLEYQDLDELLLSSKKIFLTTGKEIIKQGDSGSSMFILLEGLLDVKISAANNDSIDVGIICPGQFFGEMSLFTGEDRSATIISLTDSYVLEITKEALKIILNKKPRLIKAFCDVIAERQSVNFMKMDDFLNKKESFIQKLTAKIKLFFDL